MLVISSFISGKTPVFWGNYQPTLCAQHVLRGSIGHSILSIGINRRTSLIDLALSWQLSAYSTALVASRTERATASYHRAQMWGMNTLNTKHEKLFCQRAISGSKNIFKSTRARIHVRGALRGNLSSARYGCSHGLGDCSKRG